MKNDLDTRTVAVIGAGPIGLAAAAHLLERGFAPVVLEAGAPTSSAIRPAASPSVPACTSARKMDSRVSWASAARRSTA